MFCSHCGAEINDEAVVCVKCGCPVEKKKAAPATGSATKDDTWIILVKIFLIVGCVSIGWLLLPLAWCIPMTVKAFRSMKEGVPMSTGFKVCILIFVNLIAGIIMLCVDDEKLMENKN